MQILASIILLIVLLPVTSFCAVESSPFVASADEPTFFMAGARVLWGLLIVVAVMLVLYALVKKKLNFFPGNAENAVIQIVETKHLTPKKALHLLCIRDEEFLIGVSENSINFLTKVQNQEKNNFDQLLEESIHSHETEK